MTTENKQMETQQKSEIQPATGEPTREGVWFRPQVDIYETESGITLRCDMPGVSKEGLDVDLREDTLTVTGTVASLATNRRPIYQEYDLGGFTRQFRVGEVIDQSKITANLAEGVLTVTLPKAEKHQPRKIAIAAR